MMIGRLLLARALDGKEVGGMKRGWRSVLVEKRHWRSG